MDVCNTLGDGRNEAAAHWILILVHVQCRAELQEWQTEQYPPEVRGEVREGNGRRYGSNGLLSLCFLSLDLHRKEGTATRRTAVEYQKANASRPSTHIATSTSANTVGHVRGVLRH